MVPILLRVSTLMRRWRRLAVKVSFLSRVLHPPLGHLDANLSSIGQGIPPNAHMHPRRWPRQELNRTFPPSKAFAAMEIMFILLFFLEN
ncbi:hypothetical protein P5673_006226 [Acropora cervicornis]|uniref:Uncharacterized protein n=1 Tax=Acropora cervicornis TaxID=6130 RepID=A0AAD9VCE9_ACRCE|nr:hypothetical protein P5673_006226 [Acropora cervicornis]